MDYCSSKFAAVGIDDAIKVELKVQGHADYIKTTVVCLEWVVKSLKILQSNLAIRNGLIWNKLVLRNHFTWPICHLLHKNKELLALRNNVRATKKFLIAKFDCISICRYPPWLLMLCRYLVKRLIFYSKLWKLWLDCMKAMISSQEKNI